MSWPRFSIDYRYTVFAVLIGIVVVGLVARFSLPVRLFPDTDPPVVTVLTTYPGVAARDVSKNLSKPMEEEFAGIDGVTRVSSSSQTGLSVVKVQFNFSRRVEEAAVEVQNAITRIRDRLPTSMGEPQVMQFSSADKPFLTIALSSDTLSLQQIRELADNDIRDRIQLITGVATVDVFGAHKRQLEVAVHRDKLRAFKLTMEQVSMALDGWNLTESGGRIDLGSQETVVRFDSPLTNAQQVAEIIIYRKADYLVRLSDVATVSETEKEARSAYHFNNEAAIAVQVLKRKEANTVEVAEKVRHALADLNVAFPQINFNIADDDSSFTELVINNMTSSIIIAIFLTISVVFLFLANFRQAIIIAISIPVSFLMTFSLMWLTGIDLNMITMSAIILSIGLLVDDSIVVLENVHRHLQMPGKTPTQAAIEGTEEIFLADLAGTVTTLSVLIPLMFLGGFVGKLFSPLAFTLGFALASSFIVSVTLIPLLSALWLHPHKQDEVSRLEKIITPFTSFMEGLREGYLSLLQWALNNPKKTLLTAFILLVVSARAMVFIGSEMLPRFDSGNFQFSLDTIPGTQLEKTLAAVSTVEQSLINQPGVVTVSTQVGFEPGVHFLGDRGALDVNQASITVNLTPRTERNVTLWEVMNDIEAVTSKIPGLTLAVAKEKGGTARSTTSAPIDVRISGPDIEVLDRLGSEVLEIIQRVPGVRSPYKNWALDTPETRVVINRERVSELGLTGKAVSQAVYQALEGHVVTPFRQPYNRDLDVFLRYAGPERIHISDLEDVIISAADGRQLPLREVATLESHFGPRIVTREDLRQTQDVLAFHFGRPLSDTIADINAALTGLDVPRGYQVDITGEQRDFEEAKMRMIRALGLGVLAVYLVLVAQFRSFKHPVTIMVAVPLQFIGVAAGLLVAGKYLSMPAMLGIILLTGTVVNNSIVLIDYILQRRRNGADLREAILESVSVRYRPIMMTALSDVAGMLPLAMEMAVGSERFSPLATVVIGGVLAATFLTLIVIPVIFMLLEKNSISQSKFENI
ncbi:RND multidrug efflux transporter; Acriflavin resistance protein [hydrothermal vent metagenome]|uniref:RND multidrug efflux transporter Acriflavin resistance protein n=1 Tax=hydrothermal vent metagenome TaxID=652676 RepID=A0A3B1AKD7_9ZZZZ